MTYRPYTSLMLLMLVLLIVVSAGLAVGIPTLVVIWMFILGYSAWMITTLIRFFKPSNREWRRANREFH